jgi:quinol monooxygenase YgiN
MSKNPKNMPKKVLAALVIAGLMLGVTVTPAMAVTGDFYDTTTNLHYATAGLTETAKSDLVAAYVKGDTLVKEQAGGKFLDYNGAYALFESKMLAGMSADEAILVVANDTTLQKTIDITKFTDVETLVNVTGVSLNKTVLTLNVGANEILSATLAPANATNTNVTWSSSNPAVATVDANGNVVGVNSGSADITVTSVDGSKTAICTVTVNPVQQDAIMVLSRMKALPGTENSVNSDLMSLLLQTRGEVGCLGYDLYGSKTDLISNTPDTSNFILSEDWKNADAITTHMATTYFKDFMAKDANAFVGGIEVTKRIASPKQIDTSGIANKVKIVQRLKANADKINIVENGLISMSKTMVTTPGCIGCDIYQGYEGIYDTSVFYVDEIWDSTDSFNKAGDILSEVPFKLDDLAEPIQRFTFAMISQPVKN